jgi:anti-sigma factor RsiW
MTRWRCRLYRPLLVDSADGTLAAAAQRRLGAHLARCAACAQELAALRELPALLRTSAVSDPGETFWVGQRQSIARATRNVPAPHVGWRLDWLRESWRHSGWRYPAAAVASLLMALVVYRFAAPPPQPTLLAAQIAALDDDAVNALHELVLAHDDLSAPILDDDTLLAALPLSDWLGGNGAP